MDRILEYRVEDSDLEKNVNGILGKVLKHCMGLTPHEISHAKFTPDGITVLKKGAPDGNTVPHICSIGIFIFLLREYIPSRRIKDFCGELSYVLIMPASFAALFFPDWTIYYPILNFMNLYSYLWHGLLILYPLLLRTSGEIKPSIRHIYRPVLLSSH